MSGKYDPTAPFWLNRSIARAEQSLARDKVKLEMLKVQQAINEINDQLRKLKAFKYPPHKADDALSCEVHTAPFPS